MIERYLTGRMAPNEERLFQQALSKDQRLREIVDEEKAIEQALRHDRDSVPVLEMTPPEQFLQKLNMDPAALAGQRSDRDMPGRLERIRSRFRDGGVSGWLLMVDLVVIGATIGIVALAPMSAPVVQEGNVVSPEMRQEDSGTGPYLSMLDDVPSLREPAGSLGRGAVVADARLRDTSDPVRNREDLVLEEGNKNDAQSRKRAITESPDNHEAEMREFLRRELERGDSRVTISKQDSMRMRMRFENQR
jgi:hypothetical protein